jgi:hypothetical protein
VPIFGNIVRAGASRWLIKDHPGAAYVLMSMASAFNGASYTRTIEDNVLKVAGKSSVP